MEPKRFTIQIPVHGKTEGREFEWRDEAQAYVSKDGMVKVKDVTDTRLKISVNTGDLTKPRWEGWTSYQLGAAKDGVHTIRDRARHRQIVVRFSSNIWPLFKPMTLSGEEVKGMVGDWVDTQLRNGELAGSKTSHLNALRGKLNNFRKEMSLDQLNDILRGYLEDKAVIHRTPAGTGRPLIPDWKPAKRVVVDFSRPPPDVTSSQPTASEKWIAEAKVAMANLQYAIQEVDALTPGATLTDDIAPAFQKLDRAGELVWKKLKALGKNDPASTTVIQELTRARVRYNQANQAIYALVQKKVQDKVAELRAAKVRMELIAKQGPPAATELKEAKRKFVSLYKVAVPMASLAIKTLTLPGMKGPMVAAIEIQKKAMERLNRDVSQLQPVKSAPPSGLPPDVAKSVRDAEEAMVGVTEVTLQLTDVAKRSTAALLALHNQLAKYDTQARPAVDVLKGRTEPEVVAVVNQIKAMRRTHDEQLVKVVEALAASMAEDKDKLSQIASGGGQRAQANLQTAKARFDRQHAKVVAAITQSKDALGPLGSDTARKLVGSLTALAGLKTEADRIEAAPFVPGDEGQLMAIAEAQNLLTGLAYKLRHLPADKNDPAMKSLYEKRKFPDLVVTARHLLNAKDTVEGLKRQNANRLSQFTQLTQTLAEVTQKLSAAQGYLIHDVIDLKESELYSYHIRPGQGEADDRSLYTWLDHPEDKKRGLTTAATVIRAMKALLGARSPWQAEFLNGIAAKEQKLENYAKMWEHAHGIQKAAAVHTITGKTPYESAQATPPPPTPAAAASSPAAAIKAAAAAIRQVDRIYGQLFAHKEGSSIGQDRELPVYRDQVSGLKKELDAAQKAIDALPELSAIDDKVKSRRDRTELDRIRDALTGDRLLKLQKAHRRFSEVETTIEDRPALTPNQRMQRGAALKEFAQRKKLILDGIAKTGSLYNAFFDAQDQIKITQLTAQQIAAYKLQTGQIGKLLNQETPQHYDLLPNKEKMEWQELQPQKGQAELDVVKLNDHIDALLKPPAPTQQAADIEQRRIADEAKKAAVAEKKAKEGAATQETTQLKERRGVIERELANADSQQKLDGYEKEIKAAIGTLAVHATIIGPYAEGAKNAYDSLLKRIPALREKLQAAERQATIEAEVSTLWTNAERVMPQGEAILAKDRVDHADALPLQKIKGELDGIESRLNKIFSDLPKEQDSLRTRIATHLNQIREVAGKLNDRIQLVTSLAKEDKPGSVEKLQQEANTLITQSKKLRKNGRKSAAALQPILERLNAIDKALMEVGSKLAENDPLGQTILDHQIAIATEVGKIEDITSPKKAPAAGGTTTPAPEAAAIAAEPTATSASLPREATPTAEVVPLPGEATPAARPAAEPAAAPKEKPVAKVKPEPAPLPAEATPATAPLPPSPAAAKPIAKVKHVAEVAPLPGEVTPATAKSAKPVVAKTVEPVKPKIEPPVPAPVKAAPLPGAPTPVVAPEKAAPAAPPTPPPAKPAGPAVDLGTIVGRLKDYKTRLGKVTQESDPKSIATAVKELTALRAGIAKDLSTIQSANPVEAAGLLTSLQDIYFEVVEETSARLRGMSYSSDMTQLQRALSQYNELKKDLMAMTGVNPARLTGVVSSLDRSIADVQQNIAQYEKENTPKKRIARLQGRVNTLGMVRDIDSGKGIQLDSVTQEAFDAEKERFFNGITEIYGKKPVKAVIQLQPNNKLGTAISMALLGKGVVGVEAPDPRMPGSNAKVMFFFDDRDADRMVRSIQGEVAGKAAQDKQRLEELEQQRTGPLRAVHSLAQSMGGRSIEVRDDPMNPLYVTRIRAKDAHDALTFIKAMAKTKDIELDEASDFVVFAHASIANDLVNGADPINRAQGSKVFSLSPANSGDVFIVTRGAFRLDPDNKLIQTKFKIALEFNEKHSRLLPYLQKVGAGKKLNFTEVKDEEKAQKKEAVRGASAERAQATDAKAFDAAAIAARTATMQVPPAAPTPKATPAPAPAPAAAPPPPAAPEAPAAPPAQAAPAGDYGKFQLPEVKWASQLTVDDSKKNFNLSGDKTAIYNGHFSAAILKKQGAVEKRMDEIFGNAKTLGMQRVLVVYREQMRDNAAYYKQFADAVATAAQRTGLAYNVKHVLHEKLVSSMNDELYFILVKGDIASDDNIVNYFSHYLRKASDARP